MKSIKIVGAFFLLAMLMTSCGKNYQYEKVIVNNTREPIRVQLNYEHDQSVYTIQPGERKTVFICTYQSYRKPDCSDVSSRFTLLDMDQETNDELSNCDNWAVQENGKNIHCVFTVEE